MTVYVCLGILKNKQMAHAGAVPEIGRRNLQFQCVNKKCYLQALVPINQARKQAIPSHRLSLNVGIQRTVRDPPHPFSWEMSSNVPNAATLVPSWPRIRFPGWNAGVGLAGRNPQYLQDTELWAFICVDVPQFLVFLSVVTRPVFLLHRQPEACCLLTANTSPVMSFLCLS